MARPEKQFLLIYEIENYGVGDPDAGVHYDQFETLEEMDKRVEKLSAEFQKRLVIKLSTSINGCYNYTPVEIVTRLQRESD